MANPGGPRSYLAQLARDPEMLREYLMRTLYRTAGQVTRAAQSIGVSRPFFWYYLRKLQMNDVPRLIRLESKQRFRLRPLSKLQ